MANTHINKIKQLTQELIQHCHNYYDLNAPTISDYEYDKKYDELEALEKEYNFIMSNSPTQKVQGEVAPYLTKVTHTVPMLSANKSTDIADVMSFLNRKEACASFKMDGITVVLRYQQGKLYQAITRGNGSVGEDITHNAKNIKNIPLQIPYNGNLELRGEAVISWTDYEEMKKTEDVGHPRNIVSGALRRLDSSYSADKNIEFFAFTLVNWKEVSEETKTLHMRKSATWDFLRELGFDTVKYFTIESEGYMDKDTLNHRIQKHLNRETYEYPTDGWVFEYENLEYGESLGSTAHHDRRMFALKPETDEVETRFRGVEYNVCKNGDISLTALFDPVEVSGTIIQKAYVHNLSYFKNFELGIGDAICVIKANEIIPQLVDNLTCSNTYELITECPCCGTRLVVENDNLHCSNPDCADQVVQKLSHFVSKKGLDAKGVSEGILRVLYQHGLVHDYESLFHLSEHKAEINRLPNFGTKKTNGLLQAIELSSTTTLTKFIMALGINGIGNFVAKIIEDECVTYENFVRSMEYGFDWTDIDGCGNTTQEILTTYWNENKDMINRTAKCLTFVHPDEMKDNHPKEKNFFTGKKICVTGALRHCTRLEMKDRFNTYGIKMVDSVSKNCDYLICNDINSKSAKVKKALELGIPVITETRFNIMCRDNTFEGEEKRKLNTI